MSHRLPLHRVPVSLRRLFPGASFVDCADIHVQRVTHHSRDCQPNSLFVAMSGSQCDGREYAVDAIERGASAILTDRPLPGVSVPQCIVRDVRAAYASVCAAMHSNPSSKMKISGVTGTNGKTTVSWLIRSMLEQTGRSPGLLGTIEYSDGRQREASSLTTPDPRTMSEWLGRMVCLGTLQCAVELSSHALCQRRVSGTELQTGIVTNITQDHFDYHGDYESYWQAKSLIRRYIRSGGVLGVNLDDEGARRLLSLPAEGCETRSFAIDHEADLQASILHESIHGTRFLLRDRADSGRGEIEIDTHLVGRHNVSNILAAATAALQHGCSLEQIREGAEQLQYIPGRLERVDSWNSFPVFVDYAHTHDALSRCLQFLRPWVSGRLIVVFGAGGDRDRSKRPLMARAASMADLVVVTSDNPRTEDPGTIIDEILVGFPEDGPDVHVEPDRRKAILWAIENAEANDCVVIAGKGHETKQIIGTEAHDFDDRLVARSALHKRGLLTSETMHLKRA